MTKNEIVEALRASAKPYESFIIEDEVGQAMASLPQPFELVEPILEIIGTNPTVDFGMPGGLVRFVEQFYNRGYEELLMASVERHPTFENIWMLHRCFNNPQDPKREQYAALAEKLKKSDSTPENVRNEIQQFTWK